MKIDPRILYCLSSEKLDISVGEFSKKAVPSKLYNDKLKQVVISKYHLNTLLPPSTTLIPLVQIMGFHCQLYVLWPVEDFYVLEVVDATAFPTEHEAVKENAIQKLMNFLKKAKASTLQLYQCHWGDGWWCQLIGLDLMQELMRIYVMFDTETLTECTVLK